MLEYILYLCVGFYAVSIVSGCRCSIVEENDRYCANDYAIIATVIRSSVQPGNNEIEYTIRVDKCLKQGTDTTVTVIDGNLVYTSTQSSLCGASLDIGSTYLLSGKYRDDAAGKQQYLGPCKIAKKLAKAEVVPAFGCCP